MSAFIAAAVVTAGAALYSAVEQRSANKQAANAQRDQIAAQRKQAEMQNIQSAREQARSRYRAQAGILGSAANTGALYSSGVAGGVSSIGAQMAGNLNYLATSAEYKEEEFGSAMRYASAQQRIGEAQSVGAIGAALGSLGTQFGNYKRGV